MIEAELREGIDYTLLRSDQDMHAIQALRSSGRIYASTVNAVLVTDAVRERIRALLRSSK